MSTLSKNKICDKILAQSGYETILLMIIFFILKIYIYVH